MCGPRFWGFGGLGVWLCFGGLSVFWGVALGLLVVVWFGVVVSVALYWSGGCCDLVFPG